MRERSHPSRLRGETRTPPFTPARGSAASPRLRRAAASLLVLALGCSGIKPPQKANSPWAQRTAWARRTAPPGELMSYRLPLRDNPVDAGGAFRCYGHCQDRESPKAYVDCLSECPGFEVDQGIACDEHDVPPVAACLTVRKIPLTKEVDKTLVVIAIIGSYLLVVGAASVCSISHSQCGSFYTYPPPH